MQKIEVYTVQVNTDTTEGRGPMRALAYFSDRDEAVKVVRDKRFAQWCVMGVHDPDSEARYAIRSESNVLYATADEFWAEHDRDQKKARALAKLTLEERELLGLK